MSDADAQIVIDAIHALAATEVAYATALNLGRGMKAHTKRMEDQRFGVFFLCMGREPTREEQEWLFWGDA